MFFRRWWQARIFSFRKLVLLALHTAASTILITLLDLTSSLVISKDNSKEWYEDSHCSNDILQSVNLIYAQELLVDCNTMHVWCGFFNYFAHWFKHVFRQHSKYPNRGVGGYRQLDLWENREPSQWSLGRASDDNAILSRSYAKCN